MKLSLAELRKKSQESFEKLKADTEKFKRKERESDERFWTPTTDKVGSGSAIIRFINVHSDDDKEPSIVKFFDHFFKGPGGVYAENSLHSVGKPDPVYKLNGQLWASQDEEKIEQAKKQKMTARYIANIVVINDPANPANNGKVFFYRFGKKIYDKIQSILTPDENLNMEGSNPFDFEQGRHFLLKIKKVKEFPNYDDSSFMAPSKLADSDEKIVAILNQARSLREFVDPNNTNMYKPYEDLERKLHQVLYGEPIKSAESRPSVKKAAEPTPQQELSKAETEMEEAVNEDAVEDLDVQALIDSIKT